MNSMAFRASAIVLLMIALIGTAPVSAQTVQAGIYNTGSTLEVRAKPDANITAGSFSQMVVTIRWENVYGINLGAVASGSMTTSESFGVAKAGAEVVNGSYEYQSFQCTPAAGSITWTAGNEYTLFTVPVNGGVGSGDFLIVNDSYTNANNADWYFEVGGVEVTNTSDPFYQDTAYAVPLPVQLTTFTAQLGGARRVDLSWETASELNADKFVVQRRTDASWTQVGEVKAAGMSTSSKSYAFTDNIKELKSGRVFYRLQVVNVDGSTDAALETEIELVPAEFALEQNYPNPFNPETRIQYSVPRDAKVVLEVYDMAGRMVRSVVDGDQRAGFYEELVPGIGLSSGIYFYRLTATAEGQTLFNKVRKMVLIK